jgi:hypothetical protein
MTDARIIPRLIALDLRLQRLVVLLELIHVRSLSRPSNSETFGFVGLGDL